MLNRDVGYGSYSSRFHLRYDRAFETVYSAELYLLLDRESFVSVA
jgi:hypothetical protein